MNKPVVFVFRDIEDGSSCNMSPRFCMKEGKQEGIDDWTNKCQLFGGKRGRYPEDDICFVDGTFFLFVVLTHRPFACKSN